jgi:outer membrane receptor protein involved in Fe transport
MLAGASVATATTIAVAQEEPETVIVTGSRIPRPEIALANPVVSVSSAAIADSGKTNITDYLKRIPALSGSLGDNDLNGFATPSQDDGTSLGGLNLLDLRNLGAKRTLVLIDGQRQVASATGSAVVDTATIPITLIDRVDVVTGGASAIYGADGVSGAVNFIMKHDLEGVSSRFQGGTSQDGGGSKYLAAISYGHNFDDGKGNVSVTFEGSYQDRLFFTQRDFTKVGGATFFIPNPNNLADDPSLPQFVPSTNAQFIFSAPTGAIDTDLDGNPDFLGNGNVYNPGINLDGVRATGSSGQPFANVLEGDFQPTQRRAIAEADAHYDFSDYLHVSGSFKYAMVDSKSFNTPPFDDFVMINPDNAFLPADVATAIANNGLGQGVLSEDYLALRRAEEIKRNLYRFNINANGNIPFDPSIMDNVKYSFSYVYGQTDIDDIDVGNRIEDRFFAAMDSVNGPNGPTCRSNINPGAVPPDLTAIFPGFTQFTDTDNFDSSRFPATFTPGPNSGCLAFNPFDPNANQRKAIAWFSANTDTRGVLTQNVLSGYFNADFDQFKHWGFAGPLSLVVGGEYRKETSSSTPDPLVQNDLVFDSGTLPVAGRFDVAEFFAEANLPIILDQPFAKELSVSGAVRQSHYSTAGDATSWNVGGIWQPIDLLRFRATEAYAVRAPNVGELFAPQQRLFNTVNDPCDSTEVNAGTPFRQANCIALFQQLGLPYDPATANLSTGSTIPVLTSGNATLRPESARTFTAGVVITPPDSNFVFTADWYNVAITNAIVAPTPQQIADECVDLSSIDNPFCASVSRFTTPGSQFPGAVSSVTSTEINVASYVTAGLDVSATYQAETQDWFGDDYGVVTFHLVGNYLDKLSTTPLPHQKAVESSGTVTGGLDGLPTPKWSGNFDILWNIEQWTFDWNISATASTLNEADRTTLLADPNRYAETFKRVPGVFTHDIQVNYEAKPGWNVYAGINNLLYQKPAIGFQTTPVDPLGRFFYAGIRIDTAKLDDLF